MTEKLPAISVRPVQPADVPLVHGLIRELAEYENRLAEVVLDTATLAAALFGPERRIEAVIAEAALPASGAEPPAGVKPRTTGCASQPAGFALFLHTFSTFRGQPNLYIEDLFVRPAFRRLGAGQALVRHLAQAAIERGCGRLEWSVLTWNSSALEFYRQLGAEPVTDWAVYELSGPALRRLAAGIG